MTLEVFLLLLTPALPLAAALAAPWSAQPLRLLPWTAVPGLVAAFAVPAGTSLELPQWLLGSAIGLDRTGAVFLGLCAALWCAAGLYAQGYLRGKPRERSFCLFWQLTMAGSLGACLAEDVIAFYVCFAMLSLAAYGLVVHDRSPASLGAGRVYIALAVFGEVALLLGLLIGAHAAGSVRIDDVRDALAASPWTDAAVLGLLAGLGLKAGLVPLHVWLPLAHSAAPVPASAVLSGALVKAGILGLLRLLPMDASLPHWGAVLTWLGLLTAYAGVVLGVAQRQPKAVLAYSTMSQMGLLVALLGAGVSGAQDMLPAAHLHALHHGLAKGALFLSVGLLPLVDPAGRRWVLATAAVLGASMAGLPLTGGALAKLAAKAPMGEGAAATLVTLATAGTWLLVVRFLVLVRQQAPGTSGPPSGAMMAAFVLLALAAAVGAPLWAVASGGPGLGESLGPAAINAAAVPLVLGSVLAVLAWRTGVRMPRVPVGDLAAWAGLASPDRPAKDASGSRGDYGDDAKTKKSKYLL